MYINVYYMFGYPAHFQSNNLRSNCTQPTQPRPQKNALPCCLPKRFCRVLAPILAVPSLSKTAVKISWERPGPHLATFWKQHVFVVGNKSNHFSINGKGCLAASWRQNISISAEEIVTFGWWFGSCAWAPTYDPYIWDIILFEGEIKSMKGMLLMRMMMMMNQDEVEKDFPVEMNHWASVLRIK